MYKLPFVYLLIQYTVDGHKLDSRAVSLSCLIPDSTCSSLAAARPSLRPGQGFILFITVHFFYLRGGTNYKDISGETYIIPPPPPPTVIMEWCVLGILILNFMLCIYFITTHVHVQVGNAMIKDCTYKVCSSSDSSNFRSKFNQILILMPYCTYHINLSGLNLAMDCTCWMELLWSQRDLWTACMHSTCKHKHPARKSSVDSPLELWT